MKLKSVVLAILLMATLVSPAWADDGQGQDNGHGRNVFNARFNRRLVSGNAAAGQADPNVSVVPPGGSSQSAVVCSNITPPWAGALGGSNWVSLQADCTTSLADGKNFPYSTTFSVPSTNGVSISGNVMADDSVTIQLNGNTIFVGGGFTAPTAFSSNNAAFFVAGTNTLTFIVYNVTGPSGLDYVARVHGSRPGSAQNRDNDGDNNRDNNNDDD